MRNPEDWIRAAYTNHMFNDSVELNRFATESKSSFFLLQQANRFFKTSDFLTFFFTKQLI